MISTSSAESRKLAVINPLVRYDAFAELSLCLFLSYCHLPFPQTHNSSH
jgi:hypothetical protein